MPELPEVATIRAGLTRLIVGEEVSSVEVLWPKSYQSRAPTDQELVGHKVQGIRRFGKLLVIDFDSNISLMAHLRMTGQLIAASPQQADSLALPDRSTRVILTFASGLRLFFNDQRKFGRLVVVPTDRVSSDPFIASLGPDPTDEAFTPAKLTARLASRRTNVKGALLDQHVLAGVGNIYADEALWTAMIHPLTPTDELTGTQIRRLYSAIKSVLTTSIDRGGSTSRNYLSAEGTRGTYLDQACVYGRAGQPCRRCGTQIAKIKVAGRGTHYCPRCQKPPSCHSL
jgi:formamidopyrimidine-DNA glycosylase